ncbi:hypothetical protein [Pseudomonas gingeri]|uniref:Uncharacterized protein n=1 Tax=Pseudomonas gingeri TaxID=117681 RepID=A0A7Y7YHK2_9PSED|nr:hypothetical protein [Pseudomonas gingeri]NWA03610.1 hypothetical protein [Pseudomonas gingeri]NWA14468.1 hypothetical protein [Pseudomonas gingeri]NWA54914.1 hypothetical protein [Pseudomonas gingeri]NWA94638.1 hypothetical protein [Pseudomonas gingeri]NWB01294.1 hypothetical protein [Pseudomonas gingeri]
MRSVDPNNINKTAFDRASHTVFIKTRGRTHTPDTEELRELWFDRYEEEGGKVIIVKKQEKPLPPMMVSCEASKPPPKPKVIPPLTIKIIELTFLSDHRLLKDNTTDWKNTGALYTKPDWTPGKSNVISHSINTKLRVRIVIEAEGEAPDNGSIEGTIGSFRFSSAPATLNIGKNTLDLTSDSEPAEIGVGMFKVAWTATTSRGAKMSIGNTKNHILLTFSTPRLRPSEPDDGVTSYRMKNSIDAIKKIGLSEPHKIVETLMGYFPTYTLEKNAHVPDELGHPYYTHPEIGAWALGNYKKYTAECQAICRFVRGILEQVGCPGTVEPIVVWADPLDKTVKEAEYGTSRSGLRFVTKTVQIETEVDEEYEVPPTGLFGSVFGSPTKKIRKKKIKVPETWSAFLTTSAATVGEDATDSGLNLYEACLKFTHEGVVRYYGGGAGVFKTKEKVVAAFHSLIWVHRKAQDPDDRLSPMIPICKEICHSWR